MFKASNRNADAIKQETVLARIKPSTYSDDPIVMLAMIQTHSGHQTSLIPTKQIVRNNQSTVTDMKHSRNVSRKLTLNRFPALLIIFNIPSGYNILEKKKRKFRCFLTTVHEIFCLIN